ncbi:MAG: hypothetical protein RLZZ28_2363 [Bacteroidota bacterium]|jgi:hypothetical protein
MKTFSKSLLMTMLLSIITTSIMAQASPAATATGTINGANISIKYSSPSVKGRQIWGALVPYDKVWRAGANQATILETDKDLKVEGKTLAAGKYSVYASPGEKEWTIFFNSQTGQWGITRAGETTKDATKDVLSVTVKPKKSAAMNERLLYTVSEKGFVLSWENLDVPVSVK